MKVVTETGLAFRVKRLKLNEREINTLQAALTILDRITDEYPNTSLDAAYGAQHLDSLLNSDPLEVSCERIA